MRRTLGLLFMIVAVVLPARSLKLMAPNGGEILPEGEKVTIRWQQQGGVSFVELVLLSGGSPVGSISGAIPAATGRFTWKAAHVIMGDSTVSRGPGSHYRIRVMSGDGRISDDSDYDFHVMPAGAIKITAPSPGATWIEGSREVIRWKATNVPGKVRIDLIYTGGILANAALSHGVPASRGYFVWEKVGKTLQGPVSPRGGNRIRIAGVNATVVSEPFTIRRPAKFDGPRLVEGGLPHIVTGQGNQLKEQIKPMTITLKPDLKVVRASVTPKYENMNFYLDYEIEVKNVGSADIVDTATLITNWVQMGSWTEINRDRDLLYNLKVGESWKVSASVRLGPVEIQDTRLKQASLWWHLDPAEKVDELDETNNRVHFLGRIEWPRIEASDESSTKIGKTVVMTY